MVEKEDRAETVNDLRDLIPTGNLDSLSILPDGKWSPSFRPRATGWVAPGTSHEGHGTDNAATVEDYLPDQSGGVAPMINPYDPERPEFKNLAPPVNPLWVAIAPEPEKSIVRGTSFLLIDDGTFNFSPGTFATYGSLYTFPPDPARKKITLKAQPNWYGSIANRLDMYLYTVGNSSDVGKYNNVIMANTGSSGANNIEIEGNQAVTIGYYVIASYDPTKINSQFLTAIVEYASVVDDNPARG